MEKNISDTPIQWEINISVLKNPLLWFQLVMVSLIPSSYLLLLLVGLNLFEYHWEDIPASFMVASVVGMGLFIALSLVMFLMYWRGVPTKYVLSKNLIEQYTLSRGKKAVGLLGLFGILSGKSSGYVAAGASLLAQSREHIAVQWKDTIKLKIFHKRKEIQLHNEWRTIMQVICPKDIFDNVLQFIEQKTENNISLEKQNKRAETPFARKIILTIFILIFGLFLFPRLPIHYVGVFAIATIIFALMALWSSGLKQRIFGGILFILPIVGTILAFAFGEVEMHQSGAIYALLVELAFLGFFIFLGLRTIFNRV